MAAAVALAFAVGVLLAGCQPAPDETVSCESSVAQVTPIPGVDSVDLEYLVSGELAESLKACDSVAEWSAALIDHPEIVDVESIGDDDVIVYLAGACDLLGDEGKDAAPCAEGRASGLFR